MVMFGDLKLIFLYLVQSLWDGDVSLLFWRCRVKFFFLKLDPSPHWILAQRGKRRGKQLINFWRQSTVQNRFDWWKIGSKVLWCSPSLKLAFNISFIESSINSSWFCIFAVSIFTKGFMTNCGTSRDEISKRSEKSLFKDSRCWQ